MFKMILGLVAMSFSFNVSAAQRAGGEGHGGPDFLEMRCFENPTTGKGLAVQVIHKSTGERVATVMSDNEVTALTNVPVTRTDEEYLGTPMEKPRAYAGKKVRLEVWITLMPLKAGVNERAGKLSIKTTSSNLSKDVTCYFYL